MSRTKSFNINVSEDENNSMLEVSISRQHDFKIDMKFAELVEKLEEVFTEDKL